MSTTAAGGEGKGVQRGQLEGEVGTFWIQGRSEKKEEGKNTGVIK